MTPLWKTLAYLVLGFGVIGIPALIGRWSAGFAYCHNCERQMRAADRTRRNGEDVARLRQRASSPDAVRAQAEEDRHALLHLLESEAHPLVLASPSACSFCGARRGGLHHPGCSRLDRLDAVRTPAANVR